MTTQHSEPGNDGLKAFPAVSMTERQTAPDHASLPVPAWAEGSILDKLAALGDLSEPTCLQWDE